MKITNEQIIGIVLSVLLVLIVFIIWMGGRSSEKYGTVLGALAPYNKLINQCIDQCNREDPSKRLQADGNWNCGMYCSSVFTLFARENVPPEKIKVRTSYTDCEEQCSSDYYSLNPSDRRKCISVCTGQNEVAKWCKELQCPYTTGNTDDCMNDCIGTYTTNNNQLSWNWSEHG